MAYLGLQQREDGKAKHPVACQSDAYAGAKNGNAVLLFDSAGSKGICITAQHRMGVSVAGTPQMWGSYRRM